MGYALNGESRIPSCSVNSGPRRKGFQVRFSPAASQRLWMRRAAAAPLAGQMAELKAVGAALWHRDGASLAQVNQERPAFFQAVAHLVRVPIIPGLGSVLIPRDGTFVGAVGISGGKPEQDLDCAQHGLRALGR